VTEPDLKRPKGQKKSSLLGPGPLACQRAAHFECRRASAKQTRIPRTTNQGPFECRFFGRNTSTPNPAYQMHALQRWRSSRFDTVGNVYRVWPVTGWRSITQAPSSEASQPTIPGECILFKARPKDRESCPQKFRDQPILVHLFPSCWRCRCARAKSKSLGTPIAARHQSHDGSVGFGTGILEPSLKHGICQKKTDRPASRVGRCVGLRRYRQCPPALLQQLRPLCGLFFFVLLKPIHSLGYQGARNRDFSRGPLKWSSKPVSLSIIARKDASF